MSERLLRSSCLGSVSLSSVSWQRLQRPLHFWMWKPLKCHPKETNQLTKQNSRLAGFSWSILMQGIKVENGGTTNWNFACDCFWQEIEIGRLGLRHKYLQFGFTGRVKLIRPEPRWTKIDHWDYFVILHIIFKPILEHISEVNATILGDEVMTE